MNLMLPYLFGVILISYAAKTDSGHKQPSWAGKLKDLDVENHDDSSLASEKFQELPLKKTIENYSNTLSLDDHFVKENPHKSIPKPHCGYKSRQESIVGGHTLARKKRFAVIEGVPTWFSPSFEFRPPITIGFRNYSSKMSRAAQDTALLSCAKMWAEPSQLSFRIVKKQIANIYIGFVPQFKDDPGTYGILAIADSPTPFGGLKEVSDILFDAREPWVPWWRPGLRINTISFQAALCHELGHSLALDHSADPNAIMFGELQDRATEIKLGSDDIAGIQALYGQPNGESIVNRPAVSLPPVAQPPSTQRPQRPQQQPTSQRGNVNRSARGRSIRRPARRRCFRIRIKQLRLRCIRNSRRSRSQ